MKILGIGESVIDKVSIEGSQIPERHIGGSVLAALILLARLGQDCTFITSLGGDKEGELIKEKLLEENVKFKAISQKQTKVNKILVSKNGVRTKIRGKVRHSKITSLDKNLIAEFDLIIIDRHEQKAFYEILEKKKPGAKIIIDPSTEVSKFTQDMIAFADYPIIPIESLDGKGLNLRASLEQLYRLTKKTIIVTAGELGSLIFDGQKIKHIPGFKVNVLDVTGAGDVYRGAFAYGIINNKPLIECVNFANLISALQCTKLGNVTAIPTVREIEKARRLSTQTRKARVVTADKFFEKGLFL